MLKTLFFMSLTLAAQTSLALTGNEIVQKADEMRFIETDVSFKVEVNDFKGSSALKTQYKVFSKGSQMSRVETTYPERQSGRKLLMKGNDLWLFTPDVKRPTRVSMQQRLTGEVANGDISRTNFGDDYEATIVGEEKLNGVDTYHLALKQKRDDVTYPAIDYWVKKAGFMPLQAVFKTDGGKALKTADYKEPKKFLNRNLITKIEIKSSLNKEQKIRFDVLKVTRKKAWMIRSSTKKLLATNCMTKAAWALGGLLLVSSLTAYGATYRYEVNFDARYGVHTYGEPSVSTHRHTIQFEQTAKFNDRWSGVLGFRGEAEAAYAANPARYANTDVAKYDSQTFLLRDNYLQYKNGSIQIRAGNQQVVWGEAFGSYYADIVNPKDYREGGLGDLARNRLASPLLNMQWIGGSSSVQLIYIPVSMPSLLPKNGSDFAVFTLPEAYSNFRVSLDNDPYNRPTRGEGGIRITKQIFDFDFSAFYFNYYDRFPCVSTKSSNGPSRD